MDYIKTAFESRGLDYDFDRNVKCERCEYQYHHPEQYPNGPKQHRQIQRAVDVDHIYGRGGKHDKQNLMNDPKNLIFLCRKCHTNKGGDKEKKIFEKIVLSKIQ